MVLSPACVQKASSLMHEFKQNLWSFLSPAQVFRHKRIAFPSSVSTSGLSFTNFISLDLRLGKKYFKPQYNRLSKVQVLKIGVCVPNDMFHGCLYIIFFKVFYFKV